MPRSSRRRARTSRTITVFVVAAATAGAAVQIHRLRRAHAAIAQAAHNATPVLLATTDRPTPPDAPAPATQPAGGTLVAMAITPDGPTAAAAPAPPPTVASLASAASVTAASLNAPPSTRPAPQAGAAPAQPQAASAQLASATFSPAGSASALSTRRDPIADAQAAFAAGDLLSARKTLNDALLAGSLSASETQAVKQHLAQINQTLVFSSEKFPDDPYGGIVTVKPGQRLSAIANAHDITWELLMRLNNLSDPRKLRAGQTLKVIQGPFHAVVTKHAFTLDLYLGGTPGSASCMYVTTFNVGLGKDNSTPTGTWMVEPHHKIKHPTYYSPRGEGVIAADDPKNPLGPVWVGLTGTDGHAVGKMSYGIHGTIDPDSIGHMSSMGCIRLKNDQAALVFDLMTEGKSTVVVQD